MTAKQQIQSKFVAQKFTKDSGWVDMEPQPHFRTFGQAMDWLIGYLNHPVNAPMTRVREVVEATTPKA